jgi:hypothetical protein
MSNNSEKKEEYSFEKKKKLASRISDMKNKDHLRKIRDIIFTENPSVSAKKDSGGYLMYFHNYTNDTYYKIEKYINRLEREKLERQTRSITENSDHILFSSEDPNIDYNSQSGLRYSNREKRLIKRRQYEDIINEKLTDEDMNTEKETNVSDSDENKINKIKNVASVKTPTTSVKRKINMNETSTIFCKKH